MNVMMRRLIGMVLLVASVLPLAANGLQQSQSQIPLNPQMAPRDYLVGPSDVLRIQFTGLIPGDNDMNNVYPVQADGRIQVKHIGAVEVQGKSAIWIGDQVKERLVPSFYPPSITVTVTVDAYRSQEVFINGSVNTPGVQQLRGSEMKLSRAITAAGGFSQKSGQEIEIKRTGPDGKMTVTTVTKSQLEQGDDPDLQNGDTVLVKEGQVFYINGEVNVPGEKVWQPNLTFSRAYSMSGGLKPTASVGRSHIKRLVKDKNGNSVYIEVKNLKDNTPIEPNDEIVIKKKWIGGF